MKLAYGRLWIILLCIFSSCIGDDFLEDEVAPEIRVINLIESLQVGTDYQFEAVYFNNVGQEEPSSIEWTSTESTIIEISSSGLAQAISAGMTTIIASVSNNGITTDFSFMLEAGADTVEGNAHAKFGKIRTTSSYRLEGDFTFTQTDTGVKLSIGENYIASSQLPGLYIYLTNNPNSISNAHEISRVEVFSGAHDYEINDVGPSDYSYILYYCKPFNVKVGDGKIEG